MANTPVFDPTPRIRERARINSMEQYWQMVEEAQSDFEGFWDKTSQREDRLDRAL